MATTSASTLPKQGTTAPKRMRGLALTTNFLKNGQMLIATGCFYALLLSLLVGVIYPSMSKLNMDAYVSSGVMTGILGSQIKHLSGFLGFTALELYSSIYGLIFGGILAYMTAAIIPATIETGALDLALSRPIKRWRYYLEAGLAGLLGTIIISLVTVLGIWLASLMNTNPDIDWQWLWITQGAQSALLLLAVGLGLLCGSFINAS
ncbi:MAG TPA: hypothetical protein VFN23_13165, partial [Ktedonobacteraceae bacterium]|nr:hypothetical protein [Ktedonobacteraceae bacterium]